MDITIHVPSPNELLARWRWGALALAALVLALCASRDGAQSAATNSHATLDITGDVGQQTSLQLNHAGFPVISYYDVTNADLKVLRCNDPNCNGGGESVTSPDTAGDVGRMSSLQLDASGFPVISYYDQTLDDLKVMHCNDTNCAGGGESITVPDSTDIVGQYTSLTLDSLGRPLVTYYDVTNTALNVLHCNDVNCTPPEFPQTPDATNVVGLTSSVVLDFAGFPVISYYDVSDNALNVLHCNDANCAGAETPQSPDSAGDVGQYTSIALDASGFPVVSYLDDANDDLKIMHCNDANCAGGGESITSPDTFGAVGEDTSIVLDASGFPVVSYYDRTAGDLRVMRCNDKNCAGGGESIIAPDVTNDVGRFTSLALDAFGRPVVSYYDITNGNLRLVHCGTQTCNNDLFFQEIRIFSTTTGWPTGPMGGACYNVDPINADALFVVCDNDTGPALGFSNACLKDGSLACTDDDSIIGSISVAVSAGGYNVSTSSAPGHAPDPRLFVCDPPSAGVDAKCAFSHTPLTRPWFPWDLDGNGFVTGIDFFEMIGHFGQSK
jgi:hypothetical protein